VFGEGNSENDDKGMSGNDYFLDEFQENIWFGSVRLGLVLK